MRLLINFIILLLLSSSAQAATTWYIRDDGGTSTQCTGTTNAAYVSGAGQPCAFNDAAWVFGALSTTALISGGDTVIFKKTSSDNVSQSQYMVGYGMANTTGAQCATGYPYNCIYQTIPSGPDASHPTRILGEGYDSGCTGKKAQIWGTESVARLFTLSSSSHIDIECFEMTDHSNCGFRVGPNVCPENYPADVGTYGREAIYSHTGADFTFKNLDVHGFSSTGMEIGGINGMTMQQVELDGNYQIGFNGDVGHTGGESSFSGTEAIDHVKTRFNGCQEAYPRSAAFTTADYSNCVDQNDSPPGYGDGWGFYSTAGTWNITNSEWSHNVQDGLDLLYYGGPGEFINIDKSLFEGNNGSQLKMWANTIDVTNSILIGNCMYLSDTGKVYNTGSFVNCRANGPPVSVVPAQGSSWKFYNNTGTSSDGVDGSSMIEVSMDTSDCNGTETYSFSNNIFMSPDGLWTAYYNGLTGACIAAFDAQTTNYSNFYGFQDNPPGTGDLFTNPNWSGAISPTADSNVNNVYLTLTSPGKGTATSANPFWNTSTDYNNNIRPPWDMGALIYGSNPNPPPGGITISGSVNFNGNLNIGQ